MPDMYDFIKETAPFELEYIDGYDNYNCLNSHVKRVYEDYILIAPPQKNDLSYNLSDGQEVTIIFKTEKGIFSAVSTVIGTQLGLMSGLKISFPFDTKLTERREFVRVPLALKVEVIKFFDKDCQKSESFHIKTRNISGRGLCYISDRPMSDYYDLLCKIHLESEKEPISVRCDHVYSKKIKINNEKAYLTAFSYADLSNEDTAKLVKACFKYQIDCRKVINS